MKRRTTHIICIIVSCFLLIRVNAQDPGCPGNLLYSLNNGKITVFDPDLPLSSTNPSSITIIPPQGAGCLALLPNINGGTLTPTFYTVLNGTYHYWTGSTWFNTGHSTGNPNAVNIGGCGSTIYNLAGPPPIKIYTYDGTANGSSLCVVPMGCVADVVVDCDCSFYVFNPLMPDQALIKYSPTGVIQSTFALNGIPSSSGGGGFAIIGNKVYYVKGAQLYTGTLGGPAINFTVVTMPTSNPINGNLDWASCPAGVSMLVSITASSYSICSGSSVTLTASGANTYTWIPPGTGSTVVVNPLQGNNSFTVIGASSSSCTSQAQQQAQLSVFGFPSPTVNASISQPSVCSGQTVQLSASGANSYTWQPQGSGQGFSITATSSGIFTVTGMASPGNCTSQSTVQLQVDPSPTVSVSGKTLVCKGDVVTYIASGATTYSWNGIPGTPTYSFIAVGNGLLTVKGMNSNVACEGSASFNYNIKVCTGIGEESLGSERLQFYPNPANDRIRFNTTGNSTCTIFDMKGAEVSKLVVDATGEIDISRLSPGVYFIRLDHPSYSGAKFIKE